MLRGPLTDPNFKGQFSGHETFPLRHLWLRKAYDAVCKKNNGAPRSLFSDAAAIITFGVGKNMVSSIRHWALACDIICEDGDRYRPTKLGAFLFGGKTGRDPFMESPATAWLIQWVIAGRPERTTTWFYVFNHFSAQTFDREAVATPIRELCKERGWQRTSAATIKRDVECFIRSYVPRADSKFSDDSMEPVLGELGLIRAMGSKSFEFRRGPKPGLPDGVFLFALHDFWGRYAPDQNTMAVETLAFEPGSPGPRVQTRRAFADRAAGPDRRQLPRAFRVVGYGRRPQRGPPSQGHRPVGFARSGIRDRSSKKGGLR